MLRDQVRELQCRKQNAHIENEKGDDSTCTRPQIVTPVEVEPRNRDVKHVEVLQS